MVAKTLCRVGVRAANSYLPIVFLRRKYFISGRSSLSDLNVGLGFETVNLAAFDIGRKVSRPGWFSGDERLDSDS